MGCNKEDFGGRTALVVACRCSALESLEILLKDGRLDLNAKDGRGRTAIHHVSIAGDDRVLERLLAEVDVDITAEDSLGRNAVSWAANQRKAAVRSGSTESVLEFMARRRHDCLDEPDEDGWSPLAWTLDPPGFTQAARVLIASPC